MLSKKQRLTRTEFSKHFKTGRRYQSPIATLIVSPHESFHGAVVVSKKVSKKAVVRNMLRRRVYTHLYQTHRTTNKNVYIVILKPPILTLTRKQQHTALAKLIAQATQTTYNSPHV